MKFVGYIQTSEKVLNRKIAQEYEKIWWNFYIF